MRPQEVSEDKINFISSLPFFAIHLAALVSVFLVEFRPTLIFWAAFSYCLRMWAVTAGYHRYFSHRSYKTSRAFQFVLGLLGTLALQKGPLWWAAYHRAHHQHADSEEDIHSPSLRGIFWAHVGWILSNKYKAADMTRVKDLAKFPELRWLDRFCLVPPVIAGIALWTFGGPALFVWAGLLATVAQWHGLFTANSLSHVYGWRRFETPDTSRNNPWLALITLGEGWHNNHHHYPGSARQGFYWWEIDVSYYVLKILEALGLVWDVRGVPERVLAQAH
jgi:stearoyl-CoA desaturase (Delta-9 desaturase)